MTSQQHSCTKKKFMSSTNTTGVAKTPDIDDKHGWHKTTCCQLYEFQYPDKSKSVISTVNTLSIKTVAIRIILVTSRQSVVFLQPQKPKRRVWQRSPSQSHGRRNQSEAAEEVCTSHQPAQLLLTGNTRFCHLLEQEITSKEHGHLDELFATSWYAFKW